MIIITKLKTKLVFPYAPRQEKLHFLIATDGPINHFDGEPDETYFADVRKYMAKVLAARNPPRQSKENFLCRQENDFAGDWVAKFPFASHRIKEYNAEHAEIPQNERNAASFQHFPAMYEDDRPMLKPLAQMSGISATHGGVKTDEVETISLAEIERRMASTSLDNIFDRVDKPDSASNFQMRYSKFLNKVQIFFDHGFTWFQPPNIKDQLEVVKGFGNYVQFENWLLQEKQSLGLLNLMHEKWIRTDELIHTQQQAVKVNHWLHIFFKYNNFKKIRPAVSEKELLYWGFHLKSFSG